VDASKLQCLLRSWGHSREEDGDGAEVWRPAGFPFPLSRGRNWFELRDDGSAIFFGPGPDDRSQATAGSWVVTGNDEFELRRSENAPPRCLKIVECSDSVLRLRPC
jgi:hypothetical protein